MRKKMMSITLILCIVASTYVIVPKEQVQADSTLAFDLASAILSNTSWLLDANYVDTDTEDNRQAIVLSSQGTMVPTEGNSFALISSGKAGANPVMCEGYVSQGYYHTERGTWFKERSPVSNPQYWDPALADRATLTLTMQVPPYMHHLYYDVQFFTTEYPDYLNSYYNDILTVTVNSPSQGETNYVIDVNGGDFVLSADDIPGTGFDVFARTNYDPHNPTNPKSVDWISTTPGSYWTGSYWKSSADGGATALVSRGHPVFPHETITVTFDIQDTGDNQFDSAAFIDNISFSDHKKTNIQARKTVNDINGGLAEPGDILAYTITISNIGDAAQSNNDGYEFDDILPGNTTVIPGSEHASSGVVSYLSGENKIVWDGGIPKFSSVSINFKVTIDSNAENGLIIPNRGTVYWDSDESGSNDAILLTNWANKTVSITPSILTEDFSDDTVKDKATQFYTGYQWFETTTESVNSNFEVASAYHYTTDQSFKVKLRNSASPQYWNYSFSELNISAISFWEAWFACGNISENADLMVTFNNEAGSTISQVKFEYIEAGYDEPIDYLTKISYKTATGWQQLHSTYTDGYLYNGWYKLRLENNGDGTLTYILTQPGEGVVDSGTESTLDASFSELTGVTWSSTKESVVCPIFFWDEHKIGLLS
jgi:uncharacterized repeat protein (TIGR01451 family)